MTAKKQDGRRYEQQIEIGPAEIGRQYQSPSSLRKYRPCKTSKTGAQLHHSQAWGRTTTTLNRSNRPGYSFATLEDQSTTSDSADSDEDVTTSEEEEQESDSQTLKS